MEETEDILNDEEALADLWQSRADFAAGDAFDAAQVRADLAESAEAARRGEFTSQEEMQAIVDARCADACPPE